MKRPTIEARFYETYHFVFAVKNIIENPIDYIRSLHDFYGDGSHIRFAAPYERYSAFHQFLEFVLDELLTDATENYDLDYWRQQAEKFKDIPSIRDEFTAPILPIERAIRHHGFDYESFADWLDSQNISIVDADNDAIYDYLNELRLNQSYEDLLFQSVREAFFLLFANRKVLMLFNEMIAREMSETTLNELPVEAEKLFQRAGMLKRAYMPEWVRRAVFYRDRGRCVSCSCDLSGILNIWSEDHFDHIVSLAAGGLNDVTNIQLLCAACNLKKGESDAYTSDSYEDWYPITE
jgi:hypothetical protein